MTNISSKLSRWAFLYSAIASLITQFHCSAQEGNVNEPLVVEGQNASGNFSITSPQQMAAWQKHLTLGPGDVLNIGMYQKPELLRTGLSVGPDGRLNYLQARDVEATGLTIDELRAKLEEDLSQYYRAPLRVIIIPQAFNSKKYYILGNVAQNGVYPLSRPVTLIEAVAHARGFITAPERRNTLLLADLSRSFLVRRDPTGAFKRADVDFEGLFLKGDLTQNIALAPDDYLYFPPLDIKEIYVLGDGIRPGVVVHTEEMAVLRAITAQGGFLDKAYRSKVLVIRGSLNQPETFVVDMNDILSANAPDFKLEPRDIVYVSRRPWAKAEELLETAVTQFFRAAIIGWTGRNVGPWITEPIIK